MNLIPKFKKKSISIKKKIFGLGLIFVILLGFAIPLNFSLNFDKYNRVYKDLRLQRSNYSYCVEWFKTWDFSVYLTHERSRLIAASQDGNNIIAGGEIGRCITGGNGGLAFIVKLNSSGDYFWNKTLLGGGNGILKKLLFCPDNNFYVLVTSITGMLCDQVVYSICKFDKEGNLLYETAYFENFGKEAFSMTMDSLENIYIVGHKYGEMFISKYNQLGNLIWNKYYNEAAILFDIDTDSQDNIFGISKNSFMKFNSDGNLIWTLNLSDCKKIRIDKNDNIYILTNSELFKFDEDGNKLWQMSTTSSLIELDDDNNIYLLEFNELIKVYSNDSKEYLILDDYITAFCFDSEMNIYTTGIYNSDFIVKKYGIDKDYDNLTDWSELNIYYTNPNVEDTDGDGLSDGEEVYKYFTNPNDKDSDGDGLSDGEEVYKYFTNPNDKDSDGDGLSDGEEVTNGFDPNNKFSNPFIYYTTIIVPILIVVSMIVIIIIILKKKYKSNSLNQ